MCEDEGSIVMTRSLRRAASSPARLRGLGLIALAAVSWGTTGSVTTLLVARAEATPLVVGAARVLVAAVLLLAAAGGWRRRRGGVAGGLWPAPRDAWRCLALGACMAAFQATYFTAVTRAGIAVTALVAICSAPIMIATLAAVLLGERPTPRLALALGLGVAGTALLVAVPIASTTAPRPLSGVVLALGAGFAYALYVVLAKAALARTAPLPLAALTFAVAAVLMAPALAAPGLPRVQGIATVVASPLLEIVNVPLAVSEEYEYAAQPEGDGGTDARNGPANWPTPFVTVDVRSVSARGTTFMCAE